MRNKKLRKINRVEYIYSNSNPFEYTVELHTPTKIISKQIQSTKWVDCKWYKARYILA